MSKFRIPLSRSEALKAIEENPLTIQDLFRSDEEVVAMFLNILCKNFIIRCNK